MTTIETHTIDEALAKFDLVNGVGNGQDTACVMSAISWVAGEAFGDAPSCAHPALRRIAIGANDHPDTTPEQRAEILKAGEFGLIDTWWVPTEVIVAAMSPGPVAWPSCSRCGVELRRAGASGWRRIMALAGCRYSGVPTRCGFITGRWQQRTGLEWALGFSAEQVVRCLLHAAALGGRFDAHARRRQAHDLRDFVAIHIGRLRAADDFDAVADAAGKFVLAQPERVELQGV